MVRGGVRIVLTASCIFAIPCFARAEHEATAAMYVREDTDHTTVVSPRLRVRAPVVQDETHIDASYTVDVWTSASVDIVASASQPVTEQRDELNLGLDHVFGDVTVRGNYRFSTEPDYESHGGSVGVAWNLADNAFTLGWSGATSFDRVGRAGDEDFAAGVDTFATGLSLTQVLDPDTVVQLLYDLAFVRGYQASAYRFVAFGSEGPCGGSAPLCRPEQNPRERTRHAASLRLRRALGSHVSTGGSYRFYLDDWGVVSHTAKLDLAWALRLKSTLALSYRFYTQTAADHYKRQYQLTELGAALYTRDKELSPLSSHRVALELDWSWELEQPGAAVLTALAVAGTFYRYTDFSMLDRTSALEVTAVLGMEFE